MKIDFYKQKGFWLTFATSILVISVALVTDLKMEYFVPETGKFKLYGGVGILIAVTLLFKWRPSRYLLGIYTLLCIIATISFAFHDENNTISFLILLTVLIAIFMLLFSRHVKDYINN